MEANHIMKVPVEDIIFESRNKDYGAYDIRKKYNKNVGVATAVAISLLLLFIFGPLIIDKLIPEEKIVVVANKPTTTTLGPPPDLTEEPPPPPPENIPPPPQQIQFTVPEVVTQEVPDEPPPSQEEQQQNNTGSTTEEGPLEEAPPENPGTAAKEPEPEPEKNWEFVQETPKPKIDLQEFFSRNVKYPDLAWETRIEGKVHVRVIVKPDGSVDPSTAVVAHGLKNGGAGINDEALRLVKIIPPGSFSPGNNNGVAVRVWVTIPVRFAITD